jgi:hypothetical protein
MKIFIMDVFLYKKGRPIDRKLSLKLKLRFITLWLKYEHVYISDPGQGKQLNIGLRSVGIDYTIGGERKSDDIFWVMSAIISKWIESSDYNCKCHLQLYVTADKKKRFQ